MIKEQYIHVYSNGTRHYYSNRELTTFHREDGPAVEYPNGTKKWYHHGQRHREDGPASEYANGTKKWYHHGQRHRENGPAIEYANGIKEWWLNGQRHREDGPAIEEPDGIKEWYHQGTHIPEPTKETTLTLQEVADLAGVDVKSLRIRD